MSVKFRLMTLVCLLMMQIQALAQTENNVVDEVIWVVAIKPS